MRNKLLVLITIIIAMASLLYELILAQMMSSIYGGTVFYYILVIGIYVFCLGMGSLFYPKIIRKDLNNNLFNLELYLSISGAIAPILALFIDHFFHNTFGLILNFMVIGWIGFLSGIELPLLMDIYNKDQNSYSGYILFVDFLGTFLACLLFPLVFIPYFHLFQIAFIIGALNLVVVVLVPFLNENGANWTRSKYIAVGLLAVAFLIYFVKSQDINNYIINNYFLHIK